MPVFQGPGTAPGADAAADAGGRRDAHAPAAPQRPQPVYEAYRRPEQPARPATGGDGTGVGDLIGVLIESWTRPPEIVRLHYTMAAGKGVHFWCFAQSISALDSSWGKEHRKTLLHLAELVQVLGFPRTDAEGAEELSRAIGTATFEGRTESKSGTVAESRIVTANTQWQAGESTSLVRERLVTPDELMTLGPDRQYVIAAAKDMPRDALYLHHAPYWRRPDARWLADPNPFVLRKKQAERRRERKDRRVWPLNAFGGTRI